MWKRIKDKLLHILPKGLVNALATARWLLQGDYLSLRRRLVESERHNSQLALYVLRQQTALSATLSPPHQLNAYELSVHSQNGEDGILFFLFSLLGSANRCFVEFGIGDGRQCNTANLSLNFGWSGLLLEVDGQKAAAAQKYYQALLGSTQQQVCVRVARVTAENINQLLAANKMTGEIDLLSIDIDGNDYWVWQAITVIQPRVVVIEYNASFGPFASVTVDYDPNFDRFAKHSTGYYHGASLTALAKLAQNKGYILAGCDSSGTNAFFVRQDVAANKIEPISVADAFFPSFHRSLTMSQEEQVQQVAHMPFQEVK
jgi:hypothetical protein